MTKREIFFYDDPIHGTYPEFGGRTKMLKFFKANNAHIVTFGSDDKVSNRRNFSEATDFIEDHPDYQLYTLIYNNGWSGAQTMDRGVHVCNSAYKYVAVRDDRFKVMKYESN